MGERGKEHTGEERHGGTGVKGRRRAGGRRYLRRGGGRTSVPIWR